MKKIITFSIALLLSYVVQAQFYNNGGTLSISTGGILQVNNAFTNKSGGNLVNNGTLNVKGNLTNEQTMSNPHNGTLHLSGSSPQTIGGTAALLVKNLTFNNAAGISLSKSLKADGEVQFQSGIVAASSSAEPLAFTSNGLVSATNAPSNTSHVNGYVLREGTGTFDFPVGDGTRYQKVGTNLTANGTGLLAKYNASDAGTGTFATTGASATALTSYNTQEHWDISPLSTATGTVTIHWDDYKTPTLTDISLVKVAHKSGTNWLNQGGTGTGTTSTGSVTSSSVSTWSPFTLGLTAAASGCPSGNTLLVNASVVGGTGDGSSWSNAYASLSNALATAHACSNIKTIQVAAGTYKPTKKPFNTGTEMTTADGRDVTFHIPDGVTIEGGYNAATGGRDITANVTILSGDIDNNNTLDNGNAYHVVLASAASSGGVGVNIDGFSITGGNANGSGHTVNGNAVDGDRGAGIYCVRGTNTFTNNNLSNNSSYNNGGGIFGNQATSITLTNNTISNNAGGVGGGVFMQATPNCNFTNNRVSHNSATSFGGGIAFDNSSSSFENNTIHNNSSTFYGGGIYVTSGNHTLNNNLVYNNSSSSGGGLYISYGSATATLTNNTIHSNTVTAEGGGVFISGGDATLRNNVLYNNTATNWGGGVTLYSTGTLINNTFYNNSANNGGGLCVFMDKTNTFNNNIFWANKKGTDATVASADVYTSSTSINTFKNNLLQLAESSYTSANSNALGSGPSGNIFNQDPLFVNAASPAGADDKHRTADDGLSLQITSLCVNAGTTGTGIPTTDITGTARTGNPDMGAYEAICTTPTFNVGTPTKPTTCGGTNGSIPLTGLMATTNYSVSYQKDGAAAVVQTLTTNASGGLTIGSLGAGNYTNITVTLGSCTSTAASVTLANPPSATASISGTTTVCQNAPNPLVTFTGANGTAPYTFTYRINGGTVQTLTTSGSSNNATLAQTTSTVGLFSYVLESVNDAQSCGQNQSGSATVTVQGKPTISLNALQQTLNEGNNPVLCDTDADPVNSLQFNVSTNCVSGSPLWRVQVGSGAWSDWSATAPVTQSSNNQPHRYQAACDANCPVTYSSPIELTINYRASAPQNVSLVVDGVSIAAGQTKEVCSLVNTILTFNANCANGEVILYSVDGGEYSAGLPTGLLDNQFHNYRVRCRKADATPSCVESESGVMRLKLVTIPAAPTVSLSATTSCDATASFNGQSTCGTLRTIWYNATTNIALPTLPSTVPNQTASYYARCQTDNGCVSEKSNVVTFTLAPTQVAPIITASQEIVCTGTTVTISANCPAGSQTFWNTGVTVPSFQVAFNNVTKQTYFAKCIFEGGCQSAESIRKDIYWNAFVVTLINIGQSQSAIKTNNRNAWTNQFITRDNGPELEQSTQQNPTIYYVENANKIAPRYWTINVETCNLGTNGSLTFDMQAVPEIGVIRSYNTHENNAPYFMYANRDGWTELYAQNHPAYGFYQDNGAGGNVYDTGLPKGLYKLGVRYWEQKGWGSIFPSTRKPQGSVLAYQEYWFRIQSKDGVGTGAARVAVSGEQSATSEGVNDSFVTVLPNPVTSTLRLKVQDSKAQAVQTVLTDASGRQVVSRSFVPDTNTHQEEFNVSELANGIYFLKVNAGDKQETLKVVKVQ